jgi:tetratricopeptide (TPR) repeat protein
MFARPVYTLLTPALERQPDDVAAWEARGQALWWDKRPREALDSLEEALNRAPRRELALRTAALVTLDLNETERSIAYWDRVLAIDPYTWQAHVFRAQALALRKQWGAAVEACDASLRLNPFESRTRMLLIDCLIHQGKQPHAREELAILLALRASPPEQIQKWFDELMSTGR